MSRHVPVDVKSAVVERLRTIAKQNEGQTPSAAVRAAAEQCGVQQRTVWRWLEKETFEPRPKVGLSRDQLITIALHNGNVKTAWESLSRDGLSLCYEQFWRRLKNMDSDFIAGVTKGLDAALQEGQYVQRDTPRKMSMVGFDHTELPVWCIPDERSRPVKPWISVIQDWGTRYILGVALTHGRGMRGDPNTETVVALVGGVLAGFEAPDGTPVGGQMQVIVSDNANAHLAEAIINGYAFLGVLPHYIDPGSPCQNGRTERLIGTIEAEFCMRQPGYSHQLPLRYGTHEWESYLSLEELTIRLTQWMDYYNTERPHSALRGRTPLQAWQEDPTIVEHVDPALVRHGFLVEKRKRKISKNGVRFRNVDYTAPEFAGKTGREVTIRYLPNDRSFIDTYLDGQFFCTAIPHEKLTLEERTEIARVRQRRIGRIDHIVKTGARRREEEAFRQHERQAFATGSSSEPLDKDQDVYLRIVEGATDPEAPQENGRPSPEKSDSE